MWEMKESSDGCLIYNWDASSNIIAEYSPISDSVDEDTIKVILQIVPKCSIQLTEFKLTRVSTPYMQINPLDTLLKCAASFVTAHQELKKVPAQDRQYCITSLSNRDGKKTYMQKYEEMYSDHGGPKETAVFLTEIEAKYIASRIHCSRKKQYYVEHKDENLTAQEMM